MASFETRSSQFGLVSGIRQATSDLLVVVEPAALFAPEARKGRLYVVAEVAAEVARSRDACQIVTRTIRKVFYEDSSYSVTSSLRKAISAANKALYQHNFNAPAQKRAIIGVTCAVVKGHDLYLAQIFPAQAYLLAGGKLRALPDIPSWTGGQTVGTPLLKPNAIGSSLTIEPEFYRAVLRPGDAVVLCSSNLAPMLSREEVLDRLRVPDPAVIIDGLVELCQRNALAGAQGLAICAVAPLSPAAQAVPLSRAGLSERGRLVIRAASGTVGRLTSEVTLLLRGANAHERQHKAATRYERTRREAAQMTTLPDEPPPMPSGLPPVRPLDLGESIDERVEHEHANRRTRLGAPPPRPPDYGLPPSAFLGEGGYYAPPSPNERRIDLSDTPGMAAVGGTTHRSSEPHLPLEPTFGERLVHPFEWIANTITGMDRRRRLRRPAPGAMPQVRRRPGLSYRREGPPFPWLLLLLLISLVALLILYGRNQVNENARQQATNLLQQAEQIVGEIRTAPDEATAQRKLREAEAALSLVRSSDIVTATEENRRLAESLEREYERALAAIRKLTYFEDLTEIGRHPQAAAEATFSSLVVPPPPTTITDTAAFSSIYLLDGNAGVLYRMPKSSGTPEPFLRPNDLNEAGVPIGPVKALAWRIDNIVAMAQSEGGAFTYYFRNGDQWNSSNLWNSEEWGRTIDKNFRLATYQGNLYALVAAQSQILKYLSGQPADPYDPWIKNPGGQKLDTAIDMAIDGDIYLLQPDGRILVFAGGEFKREIPPPPVDPPLATVTRFFVSSTPETGYIYLVDTVRERILQLDKQSGALIQQILARPDGPVRLKLITDVYVDESAARPVLYLINGSQILRASLPDPPRPFGESRTPVPSSAPQSTSVPEPSSAPQPTRAP